MNCETNEMVNNRKESRIDNFICRIRGTVIFRIWPEVLFMAIYTGIIGYLHNYVDQLKMNFSMTLVPVLGVATGLLLVFRTNTAYDRYWEGRKLWSTVNYQIRSLTLGIWLGVDDTQGQPKVKKFEMENFVVDPETAGLVEKLSALNLLVAFAYALKNYLRGEYSYDVDDLKELINHLPKFQKPTLNKPLRTQDSDQRSVSKNPTGVTLATGEIPMMLGSQGQNQVSQEGLNTNSNSGSMTILFSQREDGKKDEEQKKEVNKSSKGQPTKLITLKAHDYLTPSNIPLEIVYYLYSYIKSLGFKPGVEANCMRNMILSILSLIDCLGGFERILRTPMPLAYRIHLLCIVWIYLLALPFQLMMALNWWAVPAVTVVSFALLGVLAIGGEIENPFGYDENDLPLDDFCKVIHREIQMIVSKPIPEIDTWVMSKDNHPISPLCWLTAQELIKKSPEEIRQLLAMGREPPRNLPSSTHL